MPFTAVSYAAPGGWLPGSWKRHGPASNCWWPGQAAPRRFRSFYSQAILERAASYSPGLPHHARKRLELQTFLLSRLPYSAPWSPFVLGTQGVYSKLPVGGMYRFVDSKGCTGSFRGTASWLSCGSTPSEAPGSRRFSLFDKFTFIIEVVRSP